jgi:hypothetical protein
MRAGLAVLFLVIMSLPAPAHAQADTDELSVILLHPGVATTFDLADDDARVRIFDDREIRIALFGEQLFLRPRPGTPVGLEGLLEIETRTVHKTFRLRVVRHARDAHRTIVVASPPELPAVALLRPPVLFQEPPVASTALPEKSSTRGPGPAMPHAPEPAAPAPQRNDERASATTKSRRIELSVHAFGTIVGTTEINIEGYDPKQARRSHRSLGVRVAGSPRDAVWAVECGISGEWLDAPTLHAGQRDELHAVGGPSLRVDAGMRLRLRSRWAPTVYAGVGLQAHHRDIAPLDVPAEPMVPTLPSQALPFGGVVALGLGFEHRFRNVSLGLEVHMRQGLPDFYHSVSTVVSLGFFWATENAP